MNFGDNGFFNNVNPNQKPPKPRPNFCFVMGPTGPTGATGEVGVIGPTGDT